MRLAFEQLDEHLARGLRPLYLLTGDEPLAHQEACDAIRRTARQQGYAERQSFMVDRSFNWQQLAAAGCERSLFGNLRLMEVHLPSGKPGIEGSKALQEYAARLPEDTVTLLTLPKLDKTAQSSAWFSTLEKVAVVVPLQTVELGQLPRWIGQRLKVQGQHADSGTLEFIAGQVEGNLLAARQEVHKLGLLYPEGELNAENVRVAVMNVSRHDVFQLGDALLAGDAPRTASILRRLEEEGVQPLALLGALGWLLRGVARVKHAEVRGQNLANAMQQAKIWGDRQTQVGRMLKRVTLRQMQHTVLKMAEIDRIAKGLGQGQPWLEISRLCMKLAHTGTRRTATTGA